MQDRDQRRIRLGVQDRLVDGCHRLGASLGFQNRGLLVALGAKNGCLLVAFRRLDLRLLLAVRDVDLRLLLAFRLQDEGPLFLVRLLLQGQGVQNGLWGRDVDDLDAVDPDPPLVGYGLHLGLELGVDSLALAEGIVEAHPAEDGTERRSGQLIDGDEVIADAEQGQLRIDHLAEDGGIDADRDVVAGDDFLLVPGAGRFTDIDQAHGIDEWHEERDARLADGMELSSSLDDSDESLLDDVDGAGDDDEREQDEDAPDDQRCRHDSTSSVRRFDFALTIRRGPSVRCCEVRSR